MICGGGGRAQNSRILHKENNAKPNKIISSTFSDAFHCRRFFGGAKLGA